MNSFIALLNQFSEHWWSFVYHVTWQSAVVAGIVLLVVSIGRRWPSPLRYGLLLVAVLKFIVPPSGPVSFGIFSRIEPSDSPLFVSVSELQSQPIKRPIVTESMSTLPTYSGVTVAESASIESESTPSENLVPRPGISPLSWLMILHPNSGNRRRVSMNKLQTHRNEGDIASSIHLEFIQNVATSTDGNGVKEVEDYHRSIFLNHYGKDMERYEQQRRIHEDRLEHLEDRLKDARSKLNGLEKLVPVEHDGEADVQPTTPWNHWDRTMFVLALCGIASMLVFGVFNISFNLLESGIVTFMEHPIRAYFWAALLPVGALAVKVGWDLLQDQKRKQIYVWLCLATGILGVLIWLGAYAAVYPTLSKTTDEHIESLTVFDEGNATEGALSSLAPGGAKRVDMVIVAAQAVAEICLSAVLGIFMTMIYLRHRPVRLAENPSFVQLDQERVLLEESVFNERAAYAEAKGNENRMQQQLSVFVAFAKTLYQKEITLRQDQSHQKRQLLNKIEEQLKEEFDLVKNGEIANTDSDFRQLSIKPQQAQ